MAAEVGLLIGDPVAAGDAIAALRRYSLVSPVGDGLLLVHRLVQTLTRAQLPMDSVNQWEKAAAALVDAAIPADTDLPANWPACAMLLPHTRVVLDLTSGGMQKIAQYLGHSGSYPSARELFRLIADAYWESDAYGPEHPDTLANRRNLAYWTGEAGDAPGARDHLAALLPSCERVLGTEHRLTLTVRQELVRCTGNAQDAPGSATNSPFCYPFVSVSWAWRTGSLWPPATSSRAGPGYWGCGQSPRPVRGLATYL